MFDSMGSILEALSPEQQIACTAPNNILLTACPGSGKTLTLAHRFRGKREGRTRGAGAGNAQESPAVRGAGLARGQRRARCLSHARRLDCDGHPAWFVHARLGRAAGLGGLRGELRDRARRPACRPHFRRRGCGDAHPYTDAGPSEGGRRR